MAKKAYVGVNGIARNVSNIYVGVNGVARKVVKGYVGVNGVAQQFWGASAPSYPESWDLWTTIPKTLVGIYYQSSLEESIRKVNNLIAYYAMVHVNTGYSGNWSSFIMMSPFPDAVTYSEYDEVNDSELYRHTYKGTITDANNIVWYYSGFDSDYNEDFYDFSPNCYLNGTIYDYSTDVEQAAQDLLAKVYAIPFVEDYSKYQVRDNVVFSKTTSIRKTIRKAYGDLLWLNKGWYQDHQRDYMVMSNNVDAIVEELLTRIGNDNFVRVGATFFTMYDSIRITVYHTTIPIPWTCAFSSHATYMLNGFDAYNMIGWAPAGTDELVRSEDYQDRYSISSRANSGSSPILGVAGANGYNNWCKEVALSNISIDL